LVCSLALGSAVGLSGAIDTAGTVSRSGPRPSQSFIAISRLHTLDLVLVIPALHLARLRVEKVTREFTRSTTETP
jgi:hypothetical protein